MQKITTSIFAALILCLAATTTATAQKNKISPFLKVDASSSYVWRGVQQDNSTISIAPEVGAQWGGLSVSVWNLITTPKGTGYCETDINVGYTFFDKLYVGVTDYFLSLPGTCYFKNIPDNHSLEAQVSYYFGEEFPLTVSWATMILGNQDRASEENDDIVTYGKRHFSSYFELAYDFNIADWVDMKAVVGGAPFTSPWWLGNEHPGVQLTNVGLRAEKQLFNTKLTNMNVWGTGNYNFAMKKPYFVLGLSFNLGKQ